MQTIGRRWWLLLALASAAGAGDLEGVRTVYFLPMANGFDQYLANRVREAGLFHVLAQPAGADAIFTDALGPQFEAKLDELYPPGKHEKKAAAKEAQEGKEAAGGEVRDEKQVRFTSFRRAKGTVFLVDRQTRQLLWSVYDPPSRTTPDELNDTAGRVASRLKKAVKTKNPVKPIAAPGTSSRVKRLNS